jgi:hypothetical protein
MATPAPQTGNIALLIDADNASPASLDPVLTVLAELGTVNIRRAYGNWKKPALKTWADRTLSHGIEPFQQFDLTKGKNATDMKMTIDAIPVYGFGTERTPEGFREACTRFIDVAALTKTHEAEKPAKPAVNEAGVDPAVVALLIDAYNSAKRDERGFVGLNEIGQLAGNRSSFDVRNYGFKRLSDLMKKVSNFQSETRDGRTYVKRIR